MSCDLLYRKEALHILRKMCRYISEEILLELCLEPVVTQESTPFPAQISEVLAVVLDNEDDVESQLSGLNIIEDLLSKSGPSFDEQFTRLGIPSKISHLAKDAVEEAKDETDAGVEAAKEESEVKEKDSKEVAKENISIVVPPEGSSVDKGVCVSFGF